MNSSAQTPVVAVIGGGLAGIAAAWGLSRAGLKVVLLEARAQLGGRATSYVDSATGEVIDNCQHVSMGCCTNLRFLCEGLQIDSAFTREERLYFVAPHGRITPFAADPWPAPLHLTRAFLRLPYLSCSEKVRFSLAVRTLARTPAAQLRGQNFKAWLREHGQTENLIRNAWEVVLVSALSESLDRIDAAYARKVFVDGFLTNREGWQVEIPVAPLDDLYGRLTTQRLASQGVDLRLGARVERFACKEDQVQAAILRDGGEIRAEEFVLAVPQHQIAGILPEHPALEGIRRQAEQIETAPITSVHLWFDRAITELPHAVLFGRLSQWLFSRGVRQLPGGPAHLYQVVISASRQLKEQAQADVIQTVRGELAGIWPAVNDAALIHSRMITERRAVFSATPGIDALRPAQQTPLGNLQLAGDWTQTGWPATMEGAVRSGFLAAENILHRHGRDASLVQRALPVSPLARWLLRFPTAGQ